MPAVFRARTHKFQLPVAVCVTVAEQGEAPEQVNGESLEFAVPGSQEAPVVQQ